MDSNRILDATTDPRKLRLDRLYATRPPKQKPRVYF